MRSSFWKGFTVERDGRIYRSGIFGSDLHRAFEGHDEAYREALAFSSERNTSAWLMLAGGLTWMGGFAWGLSRGLSDPIYLAVSGPGAALFVAGQFLRGHATAHLLNAVNLFNFGVAPQTSVGPPGAAVALRRTF